MMSDTLRTIDTVTDEIVFCAACGSTQLDLEERMDGELQVTCQLCGYFWMEQGAR